MLRNAVDIQSGSGRIDRFRLSAATSVVSADVVDALTNITGDCGKL